MWRGHFWLRLCHTGRIVILRLRRILPKPKDLNRAQLQRQQSANPKSLTPALIRHTVPRE